MDETARGLLIGWGIGEVLSLVGLFAWCHWYRRRHGL